MRIKITKDLREEILLTLKNDCFEVFSDSKLCPIFEIHYEFYKVFKQSRKTDISRESKVELLQWIKKGYIETENSVFANEVKHPTFLEIMITASQVDED
ncbi:hypothetical protein [Formosa algae]|uniref:Uncharacterized protein n=1 Tax=Formosa algae TaxID=225843 RepID=A0A9X0YM06_9FLAO|nr:hypothetical protein [Formosa algae]MBP1840403.1 hypothetical protein [Formosa algae]MDQ0336895.1 hypothetical protein [Formosa algae]OEI80793.1 hypothetical protein AST99_06960 [Formosa algae]